MARKRPSDPMDDEDLDNLTDAELADMLDRHASDVEDTTTRRALIEAAARLRHR